MKTCEYVMEWAPLRFCGTVAHWRYEAQGGGHMYLCDEHGVTHMNQAEHSASGWEPSVAESEPNG